MGRLRELLKPTPQERYEDRWALRDWETVPDEVKEPLGKRISALVKARNQRLKKTWAIAGSVMIGSLTAEYTDLITTYHTDQISTVEEYIGTGAVMLALGRTVYLARFGESRAIDHAEQTLTEQLVAPALIEQPATASFQQ